MSKKWSSYKEAQLMTERWRRFLEEGEEETLPSEVQRALSILADEPLEEEWQPKPLPIRSKDVAAAATTPAEEEAWESVPSLTKGAVLALANTIHGAGHAALFAKKNAAKVRAQVSQYLKDNPAKVGALETIAGALKRGGEIAANTLAAVAALVLAGTLVGLPAFAVYDAARAVVDDTYEQVIDWDEERPTMTYDPHVDTSSGQPVPR